LSVDQCARGAGRLVGVARRRAGELLSGNDCTVFNILTIH
jgi:hypothetical protein